MKLSFANPDPAAQLLDTALRMAREPLDTGQNCLVEENRRFNRGEKNLGQGPSPNCGVCLLNHLLKPHVLHGALDRRDLLCGRTDQVSSKGPSPIVLLLARLL